MNRFEEIVSSIQWESVIISIGVVFAALLAGVAIYHILFYLLSRLAHRAGTGTILIDHLRRPARLLLPLLAFMLIAPSLAFSAAILGMIQHLFSLCFIAVMTWLLVQIILASRDIILGRYHADADLKARAIHTQLTIIVKVILVVVMTISAATMLMTFDRIRQVGVSILASAGIIGIIVGFAAQRSIATLFAGLQIAMTQPIRINDEVIVEGESGWIEEITLTYVVIKTWDLRRLVVPVTYFLEKSFQNWSRVSPELVGTVYLYADYTVPVEEIRQKLLEILQESDKWDRRTWCLQVTNVSDRTLELRALVSAADSSRVWDLRCEVREKLLAFMQNSHPESLPRIRGELRMDRAQGGITPQPKSLEKKIRSPLPE